MESLSQLRSGRNCCYKCRPQLFQLQEKICVMEFTILTSLPVQWHSHSCAAVNCLLSPELFHPAKLKLGPHETPTTHSSLAPETTILFCVSMHWTPLGMPYVVLQLTYFTQHLVQAHPQCSLCPNSLPLKVEYILLYRKSTFCPLIDLSVDIDVASLATLNQIFPIGLFPFK